MEKEELEELLGILLENMGMCNEAYSQTGIMLKCVALWGTCKVTVSKKKGTGYIWFC